MRHGIFERFPKGQSWYDAHHTTLQLGYGRNNDCYDTFYSAASFIELEQKVRKGGMIPPKKVGPPRETKIIAEEYENTED